MTKQEIITRFDQFTSEWFGEHVFSEVASERPYDVILFYKHRLGYFDLDPNVFSKYIEEWSSYETVDFTLTIRNSDHNAKELIGVLEIQIISLEDYNHDRHRMFSYVLKKVFAAFPESEYDPVDSNEGKCSYAFNIKVTE